ncbi:RHS repeat-associated core domain-containing protein [Streptomyces sp. NBC_01264]|uniref:RHS repeat-associated core domain-containing protein n=1 Tax=Streptomyces sp. NBC_01264 TaxID=2903804 RepID=UPI002258C2FC|nr:RHS repeat-associated core domain-containing protein [Streptomyces sp. NBC_01264]MCX4776950.1 RHS repeat-associated core domain-containing protein [Streptomyces sp. NBC_01264]
MARTPIIGVLALAVSITGSIAPLASAADAPGRPSSPQHRPAKVTSAPVPTTASAELIAKLKAEDKAQADRAKANPKNTWPKATTLKSDVSSAPAADSLVALGAPAKTARSAATASGQATVRVLDQQAARKAGITGVLFTATAATPGNAKVEVNYDSFSSAIGGSWSSRLGLVTLPACALTTPEKPECRTTTPVASSNDLKSHELSATVTVAGAEPAAKGSVLLRAQGSPPSTPLLSAASSVPTVLAAMATSADSTSGAGDYKATPLASSSTWEAGASSGAFSWSYPITVPPAAAGPVPPLALSYSSGSIDGRTGNTNNQGSQVGEGFDLTSSYIERKYGSCVDDAQTDKYDLCWKYDNASLVLNGQANELVKDPSDATGNTWRLKNDDATKVIRGHGAGSTDDGDTATDPNDTDGEFWKVTTGNGTTYTFGLNKLPGAPADTETNSVWTAPVFGDDEGEPGYKKSGSFSGRAVQQAWRWNLDLVQDLQGNASTYWYTKEGNYYAKNGDKTTLGAYTRGGYLKEIKYGQRADALFTGIASGRVGFTYAERCESDCSSLTEDTADNWPDVPFDTICASTATDCTSTGPSFFTRKRLSNITTQVWSTALTPDAFADVDSYALVSGYTAPVNLNDPSERSLVLKSITRTGKNGTDLSLDPVDLVYDNRPNRVDVPGDNILPINRPRIRTITSETGATTTVTLSDPECVSGTKMPAAEDDNADATRPCYPVKWKPNGGATKLGWFHKYRVTNVTTKDAVTAATVSTSYEYEKPGWRYNDDPMTKEKDRTWSSWRGYGRVTTYTGAGSNRSKTTNVYMQGMYGDKTADPKVTRTNKVPVIDIDGAGPIATADSTDYDQLAGFLRQSVTYNGSTIIGSSLNYPVYTNTATQNVYKMTDAGQVAKDGDGKPIVDKTIVASRVRNSRAHEYTYLTASDSFRRTQTDYSYDDYGMIERVYALGDHAKIGDETCTNTWYARNPAVGLTSLVSRTRTVAQACTDADGNDLTDDKLTLSSSLTSRGDVISDTASVYDDATVTGWKDGRVPTKGLATWTGRAKAYPAASGTSPRTPAEADGWQKLSSTTYDVLGRPLSATDAAGNTSTTAYTPATVGPLTAIVSVTPTLESNGQQHRTYAYFDPAHGSKIKTEDANAKITTSAYDALGRITGTWLNNRSQAGGETPNIKYGYSFKRGSSPWTSVTQLKHDNTTYRTPVYSIADSLLRPLQTQTLSPNGGRILTDTRYDSRGLAYDTYADAWDDKNAPDGDYDSVTAGGPFPQTKTSFDGAGRPTTAELWVNGAKKWSTTTSYTGDSVATSAPDGGTAARTITDTLGRTTETRTYSGEQPDDSAYGATLGTAYTSVKYTLTRDGKPAAVTGPDSSKWSYTYDIYGRQRTATDPDNGTTTTHYTSLDQVSSTDDARGTTLLYSYDELGRKTDLWQTSRTDANKLAAWTYDTLLRGSPAAAIRYVGGTGGKAYTKKVAAYDYLGRPSKTELTLPDDEPLVTSGAVNATIAFSTNLWEDGTVSSTSEPAAGGLSSETITTDYNSYLLPDGLSGTSGYVQSVGYSPLGRLETMKLSRSGALGVQDVDIANTFEEGTGRLKATTVYEPTHGLVQDSTYKHDDAGNVTSIFDKATVSGASAADYQCFTYDGQRRVTEAWTPKTADCASTGRTTSNLGGPASYWKSYTYNAGGQRASETTHTSSSTTNRTYCYGTTRKHALVSSTTGTDCTGVADQYTYDESGNTTKRLRSPSSSDSQTLTWNSENELSKLVEGTESTSYLYDADGELLIRRNTSGEAVLYVGGTEVHLEGTKKWANRYYTLGGQRVAVRSNETGTSKVSFLAGDHHGTGSVAIDSGDEQTVSKRYITPFGAPRGDSVGTWPDDKRFLGKSADTNTGLTHIGAREYDPYAGQFLSVDPLLELGRHQTLNGYTYGGNNPLAFSDPTGEALEECASGMYTCSNRGTEVTGFGNNYERNVGASGGTVSPEWVTQQNRNRNACRNDPDCSRTQPSGKGGSDSKSEVAAKVRAASQEIERHNGVLGWLADASKSAISSGIDWAKTHKTTIIGFAAGVGCAIAIASVAGAAACAVIAGTAVGLGAWQVNDPGSIDMDKAASYVQQGTTGGTLGLGIGGPIRATAEKYIASRAAKAAAEVAETAERLAVEVAQKADDEFYRYYM